MSSVYDDFRMNLKLYREKLHYSQSALAVQADCSNGLIGNIEAGKVKPSFDMILKLAEALEIHPADLFLRDTSRPGIAVKEELKRKISKIIDETVPG